MTSSWINIGPKSNDKFLEEKRTGNTHKAEASHGRMEAEVSSVSTNQGTQELLEPQKLGES